MKRATITISDELEPPLEAYLRGQEVPPSLTRILQTALREFLQTRGFLAAKAPKRSAKAFRKPSAPPRASAPEPGAESEEETDTTLL